MSLCFVISWKDFSTETVNEERQGLSNISNAKKKKKQVRWLFIKVNPVKGVSVNDKHLFYSACLEEEKNTLKVGQM